MQAIILAGGEGTRLRPLTDSVPKPMLPVMNRPMLCHIINLLKKHGVTDIAMTLCYRPETIREYFGDGSRFGVHLTYFTEKEPLGTAGSVKLAERFINGTFLVISGDAITDVDLSAAANFHAQKGADATLVLSSSENPLEYGAVITAGDGRVMHFIEKPDWDEVCTDMVNTGIYFLNQSVFSLIPPHQPYDFAKDLFPQMLRLGMNLYGVAAPGYWCDVGNIDAYRRCHRDVFEKKVDLGISGDILDRGILIGSGASISSSAELSPYCVLGDGCTVGDNVSLKDCIVWHGAKVEKNSRLFQTVVATGQPLSRVQKSGAEKLEHNKVSGLMHQDVTPEFAVRLSSAFAGALEKNPKIVLNFPDFPDCMSMKFAMLSGLIASGAKVYNLCGVNDRGAATFAVRHLHADGAISVTVEKDHFLAELLDASGAPAPKSVLRATAAALECGCTASVAPEQTASPVNVNDITDYYLKDIMSYTHYKRLNFSVGVCTSSQAACDALKKLGSMLGIVFLFTNEPSLLPELIHSHNLDYGIEIKTSGACVLVDDNGESMTADQYWAFTALVTLSAVRGSSVYVPTEASEAVNIVARSLGGSIIRVNRRELERRLIRQNTPVSRLQYALCFDYIRAVVRICEFLYLNNCSLSEVLKLMPMMHKISRYVNCPPEQKGHIMRQFIENADAAEIEADGGVSVRNGDSWVLVMPDEKKDRIQVMAENKNAQFAVEAAEEFCGKLEQFLN